jgi:cyanate permease
MGVEWRTMFWAAAAAVLCLAAIVPTARESRLVRQPNQGKGLSQIKTLMLLSTAGFFSGGAAAAFVGFTVHSAIARGMSESASGMVLTIGSLASLVVRLLSGWAADRTSGSLLKRVAKLLAVGALGCVGAAVAPNDALFVVSAVVIGGAGWGVAGLYHYSVIKIQPDSPSKASSIAQTGLFVGSAAGPFLFGFLAQYWTTGMAWMAIAAWMAGASGLVIYARHSYQPGAAPSRT